MKVSIEDQDGVSQDSSLSTKIEMEREIGKQITGYLVDLAEESPEAASSWLQ